MNIAIDAKWYINGPPSGVNVVKNLVNHLIENNTNFNIYLIIDKKDINYSDINHVGCVKFIAINNKFNFFTNLFLINSHLKKHKIDIVICQNYIPLFRDSKIKYVCYVHDFIFKEFPNFFKYYERCIYNFIVLSSLNSDYIITISETEKYRIQKYIKFDPNKIFYVHHGVDDSFNRISYKKKITVKNKYNLPDNFILYVGRLNIRKNIEILLKANIKSNYKYTIVLIGTVDNDKGLQKLIQSQPNDKLFWLGKLSQTDLSEVLASATVLVYPSLAEGFGLPPLEAMKSGVPVICSDIKIHREICSDSAVYFNPHSVDDLINKLDSILNDTIKLESYIKKGLNRSSKFAWNNSANRIINILNKINIDKFTT